MAIASDGRIRDVGPSFALGAATTEGTLYLQFPPLWRGQRVQAAFLVLAPMANTLGGDDVPLEVFRLRGSWTPSLNGRVALSPLALPVVSGIGRRAPGLPVRIDVTAIVRYLGRNPDAEPAFAVRARREVPPGLTLGSGLDGGKPPRLELYVD
jgi:hypothetical protein